MGSEAVGLVLWDVDHTLLETGGLGRELYRAAFEQATGLPFLYRASISGRTELQILAETLELHDLDSSPELSESYAAALSDQYEMHEADLRARGRELPGASDTLKALRGAGYVQTVVTGNLRLVAITKLRTFGLDPLLDLEVGAYAEDGAERSALVRVAMERAAERYGVNFLGKSVVVVGDTPADVAAAKDSGVPSIGVATGRSDVATLQDAGANIVLADLSNVSMVVAAVEQFTTR